MSDTSFHEQFGLTADSTLSLNGLGISFKGSDLFAAVRTLLDGSADSVQVQPLKGQPLELSIERGQRHKLFLAVEGNRRLMPSFWMFSEDQAVRLAFFSEEIETGNLPTATVQMWRERLEKSSLTEEEMDELKRTCELIPQSVAEKIREEFNRPAGRVNVAVPGDEMYYRFLVGERGGASNVEEYAQGSAKEHIDRLLRWDFKQGLAQCLLFCASPSLSGLIDISDQSASDVEEFFAWLAEHGDRFSQVAGIEVGIRSIRHFPALEPILVRMVEEIRDEEPEAKTSRAALAVNLLVFVDGELSRIRLFRDEPPFWRRIAAVAQAAMIERELIAAGGAEDDTSDWLRLRAEHFYMQSLADLRQQPRCIPDLISATQFKIEFLMRARIVGNQTGKDMPEGPLRDLLLGPGCESLEKHTLVPTSSAPGPVEGGIDGSTAVPEEIVNELRNLSGDTPLEAGAFARVVNFCLVFRFDEEVAGLIINILRKVQYRLNLEQDSDVGFSLILGLAIISASARHTALADEVRILARVMRRRGIIGTAADNQMRIALVACASREDLEGWCKAVGEWLFEIANGEMSREEAASTRSHLHVLCHAVPELWPYVAKADASLAAMSS
ncbi:hypothetical protein GOZ81_13575 [Agrobacterium vitis]|uniref:hypothetical protein n=1 Tax=Agrobacterium vitis TaxID=373 RepID=UPI0012E941C9|nr:hypothetical protein [Agrobacterium vitis]MVA72100.1 hypothetical protein [Agrobacterium vitis]